jgi:hypothetical protein
MRVLGIGEPAVDSAVVGFFAGILFLVAGVGEADSLLDH